MKKTISIFLFTLFICNCNLILGQTTIFSQNFETATFTTPATIGWSGTTTPADQVWHRNENTTGWGFPGFGAYTPTGAISTTYSARCHEYNAASGGICDFITPTIDCSPYGAVVKTLTFYRFDRDGGTHLSVSLSTDNGATWGAALWTSSGSVAAWTQYSVALGTTVSTTVKVRFRVVSLYDTYDVGIDEVVITVPCTPPTITGTTPGSRCGTGTVVLGATASAGTINWYAAITGGISLGTGTSFTTPSISATTTYYVEATNAGCTSAPRVAVVATVGASPAQPSAITGNIAVCQGSSQTYSVINIAGVTYTWVFPAGWTQTAGGTTNSITVTAGASSGNITVTPSNACGNGTAQTLAVTVTTGVPVQPSVITGNTTPCQSSSQTYSVTNVAGVTYNWTFPAGWSQTGGGTSNSVTATVGASGGTITVTPSNGCGNGMAQTLAVAVTTTPAQPSVITGSTTPCFGSSQTYAVTNVGGVTYTWAFPAGWTQTAGGTTNSITVTAGASSGNITVTPSVGACSGTPSTLAATVSTAPAMPGAIAGTASQCPSVTGQTYSIVAVSGATSYTWTVPVGWTITAGGSTISMTTTTGTAGQNGNITVTAANACGTSAASSLAVTVAAACSPVVYNNPNGSYTIPCGVINKLYDIGGAGGNYATANLNQTTTLCAPAGQYLSVVFSDFNTESCASPGCDHLFIYNGSSTASPLIGDYYGNNLPPILWSASAGGCLTFNFKSDGSFNNYRGFAADVVCTSAPIATAPNTDCVNAACLGAGPIIVNSGNTGGGLTDDLPAGVKGCLQVGERNTSWYYFDIAASGTLQLDIFPNPSTKDYDFALYKLTSGCPTGPPVRCSFSAPGGTTGINTLQNNWQCNPSCSSGDVTEDNVTGNNWVNDLSVVAGEHYLLVLGDYTSSGASSASVALTGTAGYNCTSSLPIELISFKGICNVNNMTFNWSTASELNNDFFTLEESLDAISFNKIADVNGAGNSNSVKNYEYFLLNENQNKYFRLKQTDFDGKFSYSDIITVSCRNSDGIYGGITLFPNPATNNLTINFGGEINSKLQVRIKDLLGRSVKEIIYMANEITFMNISLNDLNKGIYFIQMEDITNNITVPLQKFVKE